MTHKRAMGRKEKRNVQKKKEKKSTGKEREDEKKPGYN